MAITGADCFGDCNVHTMAGAAEAIAVTGPPLRPAVRQHPVFTGRADDGAGSTSAWTRPRCPARRVPRLVHPASRRAWLAARAGRPGVGRSLPPPRPALVHPDRDRLVPDRPWPSYFWGRRRSSGASGLGGRRPRADGAPAHRHAVQRHHPGGRHARPDPPRPTALEGPLSPRSRDPDNPWRGRDDLVVRRRAEWLARLPARRSRLRRLLPRRPRRPVLPARALGRSPDDATPPRPARPVAAHAPPPRPARPSPSAPPGGEGSCPCPRCLARASTVRANLTALLRLLARFRPPSPL
jgi:hypothetical protein